MEQQMNKNRGFSLVELLLAITILSIVMIMVTQFMGTSSAALSKTKWKLNLQNDAMEFEDQFSDIMMQATYIRVETTGKEVTGQDAKKPSINVKNNLAVDKLPNYFDTTGEFVNNKVSMPLDLDILLKEDDYTLVGRYYKKKENIDNRYTYPDVQSFRVLTQRSRSGDPYYVEPKYLYIRYQNDKIKSTVDDSYNITEKYAMYYFAGNGKVYLSIGTLQKTDLMTTDGFEDAKKNVEAIAKAGGQQGLLADNLTKFYFSADTNANTVYVDAEFTATRYKNYNYTYKDAIVLRNTNVLTVPPNKMYQYKDTAATPTTTAP